VTQSSPPALPSGISLPSGATLYEPKGCDACGHTGYRGRSGIFEVLTVDDDIRKSIAESQGEALLEAAKRSGMRTLFEAGMAKAARGETSLTEILRVVPPDPQS
jgi:general secretion pathway protein E